MSKLTVALLAGGVSNEREVSLNSGEQVYAALNKQKYEIRRYDTKSDLSRLMADASRIDVALIILHGPYGEDGTVQGMLDLLNIPYQGAGVIGSAVAMNKLASKQLYQQAGLPTLDYEVFSKGAAIDSQAVADRFDFPLVVKPVCAGSSVGISIVETSAELPEALAAAYAHDESVMIEAFVDGIEITAGVLGNNELQALPLIEIVPEATHTFFDYEAKYTAGETQEICPARLNEILTRKAQRYAETAHRVLFAKGYSRTDMILKEDEFFVLETNTIPGMTATSLFPQAAAEAGIPFPQLLDRLIELALEEGCISPIRQ